MRHVLKPVLIALGAAAAAFTVAGSASFNATPAAKAKTFCNEVDSRTVPIELIPIVLPVLPTIPSVSIPCVRQPTLPQVTPPTSPPVNQVPNVTIPTVTIPTVSIPPVQIPVFEFPTTSTTWDCQPSAAGFVPSPCE